MCCSTSERVGLGSHIGGQTRCSSALVGFAAVSGFRIISVAFAAIVMIPSFNVVSTQNSFFCI
jgi:hypothetical protein